MNMETKLDPRIWHAIRDSYEARKYTEAIKDGFYLLTEVIRDKSGAEGDGIPLVGQAFGGTSPRLKVNKLQTKSERNIQKGLEQLLRGMYQSIRNPRSHEKYNDTQEDADAILLFMNYLLSTIDKAKAPFDKADFLSRVFDSGFAPNSRYAKLLVDEVPKKQKFDILVEVFRNKEDGDGTKLRYFVAAMLQQLNSEEVSEVYQLVSGELKYTDSAASIQQIIKMFPAVCWEHFDEVARLRIENKLIESVRDGTYDKWKKECAAGVLGAWGGTICSHFISKDELLYALCNKLISSSRGEQDYVFKFFFHYCPELKEKVPQRLKLIITNGLKNGDKRFYDALDYIQGSDPAWFQPFAEAFDAFEEHTEDEIPF